MSLKFARKRTLFEPFTMLSRSTLQSKGHNQKLFQQKFFHKIVNSEVDRSIRSCSFRDGWNGITRYIYTSSTFATFSQSGFQLRRREEIFGIFGTSSPLQVKSYWMTPWWKNETGGAEEIRVWKRGMSRLNHFQAFLVRQDPSAWMKVNKFYLNILTE